MNQFAFQWLVPQPATSSGSAYNHCESKYCIMTS